METKHNTQPYDHDEGLKETIKTACLTVVLMSLPLVRWGVRRFTLKISNESFVLFQANETTRKPLKTTNPFPSDWIGAEKM